MSLKRWFTDEAIRQIKEHLHVEQPRIVKPELMVKITCNGLRSDYHLHTAVYPGMQHELAYVKNGECIKKTYAHFSGVSGLKKGDVFCVYKIPSRMCEKEGCKNRSEAEIYRWCFKHWWAQDPRNTDKWGS